MATKTDSNWPKLLILGAAIVGVGAAAVYYVKKMKDKSSNIDGVLDDMVAFCKKKASELESLVGEQNAPTPESA